MLISRTMAIGVAIAVPLLASPSAIAQSREAQQVCSSWLNSPYPDYQMYLTFHGIFLS